MPPSQASRPGGGPSHIRQCSRAESPNQDIRGRHARPSQRVLTSCQPTGAVHLPGARLGQGGTLETSAAGACTPAGFRLRGEGCGRRGTIRATGMCQRASSWPVSLEEGKGARSVGPGEPSFPRAVPSSTSNAHRLGWVATGRATETNRSGPSSGNRRDHVPVGQRCASTVLGGYRADEGACRRLNVARNAPPGAPRLAYRRR